MIYIIRILQRIKNEKSVVASTAISPQPVYNSQILNKRAFCYICPFRLTAPKSYN